MQRPTNTECRRVYRMIQAHCMIRLSTRVGRELRSIVGQTGDIAGMNTAALASKFNGIDLEEAKRLVALAEHNRRKKRD